MDQRKNNSTPRALRDTWATRLIESPYLNALNLIVMLCLWFFSVQPYLTRWNQHSTERKVFTTLLALIILCTLYLDIRTWSTKARVRRTLTTKN